VSLKNTMDTISKTICMLQDENKRVREATLEEAAKECEKLYALPIHCEEVGMCAKAIRNLIKVSGIRKKEVEHGIE